MATIRASQLKTNVANLMDLGESGRRVLDAVPRSTLDAIEQASRVGWLPLELDIAMNDAVDQVLGRAALERWSRDTIRLSMEGPLLGPLVSGAVRIFGLDPGSIFKIAPRGWEHLFQDCGRLEWHKSGNDSGELSLVDAPTCLVESDAYLAGTAAAFTAIFDITRVKGTVTRRKRGPQSVVFEIAWSAR